MPPSAVAPAPPRAVLADLPPGAVVIHGGMYKTGTSSLQNAMALDRGALAAAGWRYPDAGLLQEDAIGRRHKHLMAEIRDRTPPRAWARLRDELAAWPGRALISHENLFSPKVDPERVVAQLPGREVVLLVYVRHPADYLESCYREWVRRWVYAGTLRDWHELRIGWLRVPELVARWTRVIGHDHVILRPYDREHLVEGSTVADALALMGVTGVQPAGGRNETLNTRQTALNLVANQLRLPAADPRRLQLVHALASAEAAREALDDLPPDVDGRKVAALRTLLSAPVDPRARVMDDELFAELEDGWLPGFQAVLADHGAPAGSLARSAYAACRPDPAVDDPQLRAAAVRLLS